MNLSDKNVYDPDSVASLFNEMASTYGFMNLLTSFGFTSLWRKQCLRAIDTDPDSVVLDLMSGMGELAPGIAKSIGKGQIIALDISTEMCRRAEQQKIGGEVGFEVLEADALDCPLEDDSVDLVFSSFGLKTFNREQFEVLAAQVHRVLKPGGKFSFLETSVPPGVLIKFPYLFYLTYVIPLLGRLFLGNPDNYRLLGVYTKLFGNCDSAIEMFRSTGLEIIPKSYFFGCATGFTGSKPL